MESTQLIPLRMLTELAYCERLYHFMAVQGVMVHSADTLEGDAQHRRAASRKSQEAPNVPMDPAEPWALPTKYHFESEPLGLVGRLDAVRGEDGILIPVEAKHGQAPELERLQSWGGYTMDPGAWPGDQIQVMGQILLLESQGYPVSHGEIFYRGNRRHVRVERSPHLEDAFLESLRRARDLHSAPLPDPLVDSPKCLRCSLVPVCLPDETNLLKHRIPEPRRILPARPDGGVLYLTTPGLALGKDGDQLTVKDRGSLVDKVPLKDVVQVVTFGQGIQITAQAMHFLMVNDRTICHLSRGGRLVGMSAPLATQNVHLRQAQFVKFSLPELRLEIGRSLVSAKIRNQRVLLRRNHPEAEGLDQLKSLAQAALEAASLESLLGLEGFAAKVYFERFPGMLVDIWRPHMDGRSRRPPRDAVNAALSFVYMLLARDAAVVLAQVGLDPLFGGYHGMKAGRPALALDLMEPFRPLIADSTVLRALNTLAVKPEDTLTTPAGVFLGDSARGAILEAYEQRMGELITHPSFGYRVSYRRVLELEARMLARWLEGDIPRWEPLVTR